LSEKNGKFLTGFPEYGIIRRQNPGNLKYRCWIDFSFNYSKVSFSCLLLPT